MHRTSALVLTIFLVAMMTLSAVACGLPSGSIMEPRQGAILTTSDVMVSGNASGSDAEWRQGGAADFGAGALDGLVLDAGRLLLNALFADNFDDNALGTADWDLYETGGVTSVEENRVLHQSGMNNAADYWGGHTIVMTKRTVGSSIEAYLGTCSGTGTGWGTSLVMWQDDANQINVGLNYDPPAWGGGIWVAYGVVNGGVQSTASLSLAVGVSHTLKIAQRTGAVDLYLDGTVVKTESLTLTNAKAKLVATTRAYGDTIDSEWDNVKSGGYLTTGTFVSQVLDTRAVDPVLRRVDWNATTPSGTEVRIEVRSCALPDMSVPTDWTMVTNGQTSSLPGALRYLQYRATLLSPGGIATPSLQDVTIAYGKPVKKVEVSLDQSSWTLASGTAHWTASLQLPDGPNTVWARVTDVAGDTVIKSVSVDVDTTPPTGSVLINGGNATTADRTVTLTLQATDRYGVAGMLVSESPYFLGAEWTPFARRATLTLAGADGARTVYAKFRDTNGWESAAVNDSITLDTTLPTGTVVINDGAYTTSSRDVVLALNATDRLGVAEMRVGNSEDLSGAPWEPYAQTRTWQLAQGEWDGGRIVFVAFRDPLGHVSEVASDSIILDTYPPRVTVIIDGGAAFTNSTAVEVRLIIEEDFGGPVFQIGEDPTLTGAKWEVPTGTRPFTLSMGDGAKKIYARAKDLAGNVGIIASATITLDTLAPTAQVAPLPAKAVATEFNVSWSGTDATSGIADYDVQCSDGDGPWTEWLVGTNLTVSKFSAEDGHTYRFRARARDVAGNLEAYPEAGAGPVRVLVPVVTVTIDEPLPDAVARDKLTVRGTSAHTDPEIGVKGVLVSVDGGPWQNATGTTGWSLELDLGNMAAGPHVLTVKAFDGERYSTEASRTFIVENPQPKAAVYSWLLLILVVAAVCAAVAIYFWRRPRPG